MSHLLKTTGWPLRRNQDGHIYNNRINRTSTIIKPLLDLKIKYDMVNYCSVFNMIMVEEKG